MEDPFQKRIENPVCFSLPCVVKAEGPPPSFPYSFLGGEGGIFLNPQAPMQIGARKKGNTVGVAMSEAAHFLFPCRYIYTRVHTVYLPN